MKDKADEMLLEGIISDRVKHIDVDYDCNNNCLVCYNEDRYTEKRLSTEDVKQEVLGARREGFGFIELLGGEPTLRNDIFELISFIREEGLKVGIVTNGRMFSYRAFAKKIIESGLNYGVFSLYSHDHAAHDYITQVRGSFDQTIKGIRNAISCGLYCISVNTVITSVNCDSLQELVDFVRRLGVGEIHFINPVPIGRALDNRHLLKPVSEISARIAGVLDAPRNRGMDLLAIDMPFCVMKGYERFLVPCSVDKNSARMPECGGCRHLGTCGVKSNYVRIFGRKEFSPVK